MADLRWDRAFALEQAGDDKELLAELLELLRQTTAADLEKGRAALAAGDGKALANAAHNTKGSAAGLGLESLRQVASDLEQAGRAGDLATAAPLLARLEELVSQVQTVA
ncbi:MAG: Hpt domain-containing protein [Desulfurivibrio sp.]|nr:Hpt domain-containing protein [Desulfurivibrio sp.]